jgi:hypothetical protein
MEIPIRTVGRRGCRLLAASFLRAAQERERADETRGGSVMPAPTPLPSLCASCEMPEQRVQDPLFLSGTSRVNASPTLSRFEGVVACISIRRQVRRCWPGGLRLLPPLAPPPFHARPPKNHTTMAVCVWQITHSVLQHRPSPILHRKHAQHHHGERPNPKYSPPLHLGGSWETGPLSHSVVGSHTRTFVRGPTSSKLLAEGPTPEGVGQWESETQSRQ